LKNPSWRVNSEVPCGYFEVANSDSKFLCEGKSPRETISSQNGINKALLVADEKDSSACIRGVAAPHC
jgi:hypothetical protein